MVKEIQAKLVSPILRQLISQMNLRPGGKKVTAVVHVKHEPDSLEMATNSWE